MRTMLRDAVHRRRDEVSGDQACEPHAKGGWVKQRRKLTSEPHRCCALTRVREGLTAKHRALYRALAISREPGEWVRVGRHVVDRISGG